MLVKSNFLAVFWGKFHTDISQYKDEKRDGKNKKTARKNNENSGVKSLIFSRKSDIIKVLWKDMKTY